MKPTVCSACGFRRFDAPDDYKCPCKIPSFKQYQERAEKTAVYPGQGTSSGLMYATLGLAGEAGEIANKVKKVFRDDEGDVTTRRRDDLRQELGDVLWYVSALAQELGLDLGKIARDNLGKLESRAERGKLKGEGDDR